jgi:hypothetical protein
MRAGAFLVHLIMQRDAALPAVTAYGRRKKQAIAAVQALALRLIADRLEHGGAVAGEVA